MEFTKLFKASDVKKYFDKLYKLERGVPLNGDIYNGDCAKQIFVRRTVGKWLKGKYLVLYTVSEQTNVMYKRYVSIMSISLSLDWSQGTLGVVYYDFTKPFDIFNEIKIDHNKALHLEGEWCVNSEIHRKLLDIFTMEIVPMKEYVFETFDWSKYPRRVKSKEKALELIKGTCSFTARTEYDAYEQMKKFDKDTNLTIGQLIEVKSV